MVNGHPVSFRSETTNWLNGALVPMDVIDRIGLFAGQAQHFTVRTLFWGCEHRPRRPEF